MNKKMENGKTESEMLMEIFKITFDCKRILIIKIY